MARTLHGALVADKPSGPTSHDVVEAVRRRVRPSRAGHTGTLDPMATGVLTVCVGSATRLSRFLTRGPKIYTGSFLLGVTTETYDSQGEVVERRPPDGITPERLREEAGAFTGELMQTPPPWSAKKIDGRRAYDLARAGRAQTPAACPISVEQFEILEIDGAQAGFRIRCSGGTYIRSLVHDLGLSLGCGAHLTALRRTVSGPFHLEQAVSLKAITDEGGREAVAAGLIPLEELDLGMATARLTREGALAARNGRLIPLPQLEISDGAPDPGPLRLVGPDGALLGVGESVPGEARGVQPRVVLPSSSAGRP